MTDGNEQTPPGWYYAAGDPPGTQRYWDGGQWQGGPQPVAAGAPGAMTAGGMQLGGQGERLLARIIDGLILVIPTLIAFGAFGANSWSSALVGTLIGGAYEIYLIGTKGATVGKSVMKLKVVNEDYSDVTMETSARRFALQVVRLIPVIGQILSVVLFLAALVMIFSDERRQVPWDKVAKTIVVSTK